MLDGISLLLAFSGLAFALIAWRRARARLDEEAAAVAAASGQELIRPRGILRMIVGPIASRMRPTSQADLERLTTRLQNAGRRNRDEVDRFLEEKVLLQLGGMLFGMLLASLTRGAVGLLLLIMCMLIGLLGADKLLDSRAQDRQSAVQRGLPGAVDLMVTCLDAGLSLENAVGRVANDLANSEPILAEELRITSSEFEAGVSMADALRRLARRVGIDDLSAMCGVIAQASALGAPIAQTLREYAVSSRRTRISVLEERAGKISTMLTVPLALFLLPSALLIILGPAVVQLIEALK
jgi:tight adherence protein C